MESCGLRHGRLTVCAPNFSSCSKKVKDSQFTMAKNTAWRPLSIKFMARPSKRAYVPQPIRIHRYHQEAEDRSLERLHGPLPAWQALTGN